MSVWDQSVTTGSTKRREFSPGGFIAWGVIAFISGGALLTEAVAGSGKQALGLALDITSIILLLVGAVAIGVRSWRADATGSDPRQQRMLSQSRGQ